MARKGIILDCTKLNRGSRWGNKLIPRLRQYCASRWNGDFSRWMCDEDLFAFLFAKGNNLSVGQESVRTRAQRDFKAWVNEGTAPEYLCSWLRTALKDREHSPFRERLMRPRA